VNPGSIPAPGTNHQIDNANTNLKLSDIFIAIGFLLLALFVQLFLFPYWGELRAGGDESYYWRLAVNISQGDLVPREIFLRPPLWPYVLSISAQFSHEPMAGRIITAILGSLAAPLMYFLGKRLSSRKAGLAGALIFVLFPNYIGFSHYLWPETFFLLCSMFVLLLFFRSPDSTSTEKALYVSFALMGISFLVKETAVLLFGSCLITICYLGIRKNSRLLVYATLLFGIPAVMYSAYGTYTNERFFLVSDAPFYNANQVHHGRTPWKMSAEENQKLFAKDFMERKLKNEFNTYPKQFANLWTPNSFVAHRLLGAPKAFGKYNLPYSAVWAHIAVSAYLVVISLGLTGMFLGKKSLFRTFSISYIALLCLSGTVFLMASRFRIPVMFLFMLHAAMTISQPRMILAGLARWQSALPWAVSMALLGAVAVAKWDSIGRWG